MKLYLVQHGDAVAKDVDPDRPLSDRGRRDAACVAAFLGIAGVRVSSVLHSGKTRARQTAELFSAAVGTGASAEEVSGIAPLDSPGDFARPLSEWTEDTMVVGHLPFMAKLVSHLIVADEEASIVGFQPGAVTCLEHTEAGRWSLSWMMRPELLASVAADRS